MANPFDQFDAPKKKANPFDQFDQPDIPQVSPPANPHNAPSFVGASVGTDFETPPDPEFSDPRLALPDQPPVATQEVVQPFRPEVGLQGAGVGAAELLGAPVDLMSAGLNLGRAGAEKGVNLFLDDEDEVDFGRFTDPIGGSQSIRRGFGDLAETAGVPTVPESEMSTPERLAFNVNRFGAQAIPVGGALARSAQAVRPSTPVLGPLTQPSREAFEAAATQPGPVRAGVEAAKPLIADTAAGVGSGAALTGSEIAFPDSPIADFMATLLGGLGGAGVATAGRAPTQAGRAFIERQFPASEIAPDPVTGRRPNIRTANQAARFAQDRAVDPEQAASNIRARSQEARELGDPIPTSGIASDDIGLVAGERGARLRDPVPFQQRDQALKDAAEERVTDVRDPFAEPRAAQRFVEEDVATQRQEAQEPVQRARGDLEQEQAAGTQRLTETEARREGELSTREADITARRETVRGADEAEREIGGEVGARRGGEVTASEQVSDAVLTAKQADEAQKSTLYREAENLGRRKEVDATDLADDARAIQKEISPLASQNESLNNILRDLDRLAPVDKDGVPLPDADPTTVSDLIAMRPRLSQARDAASRLKRGDVVERLDKVSGAIKNKLDDLAEQGDRAALKWQEAEANFRTDFAPKFREGVGAQLDKADRAKTPVRPTEVGGRFLGGGKEAAQDLNRILKGATSESAGQTAARDFVLSDMAKVVGQDGKINPARLRTWIANREGLFQAMPGLRKEVDQTLQDVVNRRNASSTLQRELEQSVTARRDADVRLRKEINTVKANNKLSETEKSNKVAELERQAADVERDIQQSATALLLDSDPVKAAKRVFSARDPETAMKEIVTKLKADPEAAAGWKRAVSEHLIERVTTTNTAVSSGADGPVSIAGLKKFFGQNEKALAAVYSPAEMNSLRRAHKVLEPLGNLSRQATAGSPTIENEALWNSVEAGLLTVTGNAITTGMVMKRIRTVLKFLPNQEEQLQRLTSRMYFEPELAQHLLTRNVKDIRSTGWNAKLTKFLAVGEAAREINEPDSDKSDTDEK